jgi:hypothetical protein
VGEAGSADARLIHRARGEDAPNAGSNNVSPTSPRSPHSPTTPTASPVGSTAKKTLSRRLSGLNVRGRAAEDAAPRPSVLSSPKRTLVVRYSALAPANAQQPPPDAETMDVALRAAVAPWLVQDDSLAKPRLSGGCWPCVGSPPR